MRPSAPPKAPPRPSPLTSVAVLVMIGIGASHWARLALGAQLPPLWLGLGLAAALTACLLRHNLIPIATTGLLTGALLDTLQWKQYDTESAPPSIISATPSHHEVYEAAIIDAPRHRGKTTTVKVRLTSLPASAPPLSPVMLTTLRDTTLQRGRHIIFAGRLEKVRPALRPYFHYDTWLLHQGVYWRTFAPQHTLVPDSTFTPALIDRLLARLRSKSLPHDTESVIEAMTLGSKSRLTPQLRATYADAGGSHLLALSGLHLGIVTAALMLLLGHHRGRRYLRLVAVIPLVWGYVWLTGAPPSLVRAAAMFSAWMVADSIGRRIEGRDSLAFAVLIILAVRPFWLFDTGFQLSALSLLGLTSVKTVRNNLGIKIRIKKNVMRYLAGLLLVSAAATISTAPVVAATFHRLPLWGWLTSLVSIPITTIVVPLCLVFIAFPANALAAAIDTTLGVQLWLMRHTGAVIDNLSPSFCTIACAYALMLLFVYRRYKAMAFAATTLVLSMVADRHTTQTPTVYFEDARATVVHSRHTMHRLPCPDTTYCRNGLYSYGGTTILRVDDNRWRHTSRTTPMPIEYLWLCRGYSGHVAPLLQCVTPRHVVLDASLSPLVRTRLERECDSLGLEILAHQIPNL